MDIEAVKTSYARWAPIYDKTFGSATRAGRRHAVSYINGCSGKVLEVGVGTGLSLPHYDPSLNVTGIDFSEDMLDKARERVRARNLGQIDALRQMDARALDFPDESFDVVAAMHILSVVPDPEQVMSEIARVCKPGGKVIITNHFVRGKGPLSILSRMMSPFANTIGWHSDFTIDRILSEKCLSVAIRDRLPPLGMMTFLVLEKTAAEAGNHETDETKATA